MIRSVYEIGLLHKDEFDETQLLTEEPGKKYTRVITINLQTENNYLVYKGCTLKNESNVVNYLYRRTPPARRDPYSLTLKPSKKGPKGVVERFIKYCDVHPEELTNSIKGIFTENFEEIVEDIEEQAKQIGNKKDELYFITVLIDDKFVGEIKEFRSIFLREVQKLPNSRQGICFLCRKGTKVGARISDIFKFATIDQPGFAHKMSKKSHDITMPLCPECFSKLALGKKIADSKLVLSFYDSQVYILPRFYGERIGKNLQFTERNLAAFKNLTKTFRGEDGKYEKFESRLIRKLSKGESYSTLNFVFFVKARGKDEVKIYLNIEDVPPSRMKAIANTADSVEAELKSCGSPRIRFMTLWKVFKGYTQLKKKSSDNPVPPSNFLKFIRSIFSGTKFDLDIYKRSSMRYFYSLKMNANEEEQKIVPFEKSAIVAMGYFLDRFNNPIKGGELDLSKPKEILLEDYFGRYPGFFLSDDLKLSFIIGMIHSLIVDIQKDQGYTSTADLRIKGYRMKPDDLKKHLTYLRDKFKHYSKKIKNSTHTAFIEKLFEIAGSYQVSAGLKWESSLIDINYAFLCGEASKRLLMGSSAKEDNSENTEGEEE